MTPEEQRRWLAANGYDPEQYDLVSPVEAEKRKTTALGAVGTGVASSIGPTLGGVIGAAAPFALGLTGPIGLGVGVLGGIAGGYLGGKGQEAAEDAALDDAEEQALALQRQAAYEKYPWLTFAGQAAPSMAFFRPSPTVLKNIFGGIKNAPLGTQTALQRYALGNAVIGGGLEAGVDLGVQAMGDEDIDWGRVAGAGAVGGLLTEPTRAFGKVGATLSRSGLDAKPWLDANSMSRPLTEVEAAEVAMAKGDAHRAAVEKNRDETDKAIIEYSVNKEASKLLKKSDFPDITELREADKQAGRDIKNAEKAAKSAASAYANVQEQSKRILSDNPLAHEVKQLRAKTQKLQKDAEDAQAAHTEALEARAALKKQIADLAAKTAKARERAEDRDKRKRNAAGLPEGPKPTDDNYFKSVQGLMAKQGMTMNEAVADLKGREDKGTFDIKGEYDAQAHAVTLNKLHNDDTPWHEYLHGIVQVLKRSSNPKHQRLIEHIENGIFKTDPTYLKMIADGKSLAERTAWAEEHIVQRGGKILSERMSNPPEGFMGGLKKWFSDWRLERDAATGFQPKYTDKKSIDAEDVLGRMAEWMAMRGERQPALQPKQVDALLADLVVKSPYDNFDSVLGSSRYARDVGSEVTPEPSKFQKVNADELVGALKVVAMHDTSVQYSKRVRANMMKRIKSGEYTVEQGQKALARFASKPFPSEMSGEDIAQVVNSLEMYHGSAEADAIRREGFKGEKLSPSSISGRGIYMTPDKKEASVFGEPIVIRTNFKNLFNVGAGGGNTRTAEFAISEGYDGVTYMYGDRREVVAFREPFDAATDQLHEYYGGKRLQRMDADEYLGDVKNYQLTSYTDHFASNPAAKHAWFLDSVVDRIRLTGESADERRASTTVADAAYATARDAGTLDGQFIQNFELVEQNNVKLSAADSEQVGIYMAHDRRRDPDTNELVNPIPEETIARYNEPNSVVKHYVEWFRKQYTKARELDIEAGAKIYHPKTGEITDPGSYPEYSPEVLNQTKWRELSGNNAKVRDAAKKELADWWKTHRIQDKTHKNHISDVEIKEAVDAYVARLAGGDMAHLGSTKFGALRKAEGIGLPLTKGEDGRFIWIEPSAANTFTSYFRRWSKDHSFFKNMEQNPDVRSILGLKDPKTGEHVPAYAKGKNPFHVETTTLPDGREINKAQTSDKNLKDFIKSYLGYYDGEELFGRTANRLVVSHWLGLMSGARDLGSSYVFSLPHLRGRDMGLMISSLKDFSKSWVQSHLYGVNKKHANRIEFATETHNKLADVANKWSDIASLVSGRTPLERITRTLQFALGRATVLKHMGVAQGADITVDRNMRRLGEMSGVDVTLLRRHADKGDVDFKLDDKTLDDALDRMAASWVEGNQGTYDARGVPSWTMSGSMSMFTSLARWNIEKFNTMKQEIVRPAMDEGDWRPFIKATLGAVFTGTLLIELSEYINNKFRANPTLEEAIREGDEEEIAYSIADSLNYAGYFGIASALANDTIMKLGRGQRPTGAGIVFPAWDFISQSLTEPIFDAVTAIDEGEDPLPTVFDAFHETIRNTFQTYRIMYNNDMLGLLPLGREKANEQNVRRDLRIFRRFEGIRGVAPVGGLGNRMLRPDTREFKEADTIEEARAALPGAFEEQRRRAKGRGDKLKSYTQGLYAIPDKTLPSPATVEGAEEFMRYREYLTRQDGWFSARGDRYWQRIFNEWVRNREQMTPAKKLLVKSYVEHLIQLPSTSRP